MVKKSRLCLEENSKYLNVDMMQYGLLYNCGSSHCLVQPAAEVIRLANAGFHLLLTSESPRQDSSCLGLLSSENPCSVLLLPQIEDVLKTFQLQQLRTSPPISGRNETSSALSVDESTTTGKSVLSLHSCLRRLQQLVSCCRHIRLAIIGCGDRGANCTCTLSVDAKPAGCLHKSDDINSVSNHVLFSSHVRVS